MILPHESGNGSRSCSVVDPAITGDALFHCQQTVGKALKGFLYAEEKTLQKTHDLELRLQLALGIAPSLARWRFWRNYSHFIYPSEFRHPGKSPEPGLTYGESCIEITSRAIAAITILMERDG